MQSLDVRATDALIVTDPQVDFCPGGALAVAEGAAILPGIAAVADLFPLVVITQDWHPADHASFASNHPGGTAFATVEMPYGPQVLWPDHCVQGSPGAAFHPDLPGRVLAKASLVLRKGCHRQIDSYSAFFENDRTTPTGLAGYLREKGVRRCVFVGLAYDFCVAWSALDAVGHGFEAVILKPLTRSIALPVDGGTTVDLADRSFREAGVVVVAEPA